MFRQDHDEVRAAVSEAYGRAISRPSSGGCCTGTVEESTLVKLAGYGGAELEDLPPEVAGSSFGCGNPLAFNDVKQGDTVLDLGSGAGIDLLIAAKKVGPAGRAIGIDMTDEMIAKARENIAAAGLKNAEVRKGIIEDLPVESSSVHWVISNCVINLSPEKDRVFSEIARVLKPGGRMRVSDIVVERLPEWVRRSAALHPACVAGAISEREYVQGLSAAGLEDVEVRERLVYDSSQLKGFVQTDLAGADRQVRNGVASVGEEVVARAAESLAGKVWSALIYGRKPSEAH